MEQQFTWTDEMVRMLLDFAGDAVSKEGVSVTFTDNFIEKFKASQTPATDTPVKEMIEVRNFYHECHVVKGHEYVVEVSGSIHPDKFPAIKKAIEEVLNPVTSTPAPKPFNWVVFTEDGLGFDTWDKKDWRGDSGANWNDTVKTFLTASDADDYILMNKPCLSVNDVATLFTYDNKYTQQLAKLAQSKQLKTITNDHYQIRTLQQ